MMGIANMLDLTNSKSKISGFTLIELMIAMVVGSIMMAAIASAYWVQTQTSREQQMVVEMQQNMRAAMFMLERDIMMAGYDIDDATAPDATITTATATEFAFQFVDDTNTQVTITYDLYDALGDGDNDIGRQTTGGLKAAIAQNIENMEFFYTLADGTQTSTPGNPEDIRQVGVSVLARTEAWTRSGDNATYLPFSNAQDGTIWGPYNDNFKRQLVTANIKCRNMIVN